jgi:signal transduction histidine kinase
MTTAPRAYALGAFLGAGAAVTTATIWVVDKSSVIVNPETASVLRGILVVSWIAAGTYMWWQWREGRLGLLVAGAGFFYATTSLMASADKLTFTIGRVLLAAFLVYLAYVYLCFPGGRLVGGRDRWLIGSFGVATAVVWPIVLAFVDHLPSDGALNECGSRCPHNALRIATVSDSVADFLNGTVAVLTAAGLLGITVVLVSKARSRVRLRRRAVEPVMYASGVLAVAYSVNSFFDLTGGALKAEQFVTATAGFLTPVAMLAGQARARSYASAAVGQLLSRRHVERVTPPRVQGWLRDALGDPTLEVALWDRVRLRFVDIDGQVAEIGRDPGRVVSTVVHEGRPVAAVEHAASLQESADIVERLAETALMLLENARLVDELQASRARIVASGDQERHRLERDLHDGAQQRLFLLQLKLRRLRDGLDDERLVAGIEEIEADAAMALEELRVLAHGIYPTVLVERGVPEALRAFAVHAPIPVEVIDHWMGRFSPTIEAAVYFLVLEAIQNAAKHAGEGARVTIDLDRDGDRVDLSISDDGAGFQPAARSDGMGLVTMRDRAGAVGGEIEIVSEPGAGVAVHVTIPHAPLRPGSEVGEASAWRSE